MNTRLDATPHPRRPSWHERLFASLTASESTGRSHYYEARKRALLGDLHGDVLEIGPGTGSNLAYYPPGVRWFGLDPNPAMLPYARREAQRLGLTIQFREGRAEHLECVRKPSTPGPFSPGEKGSHAVDVPGLEG